MSKIIFSVTNDLSYDQRMHRIASSLAEAGYDVLLVGRKLKKSESVKSRPFAQKRLSCFFTSGFLFYAEYNLRLFLFLVFQTADIVCAIDLDTILPVYLVTAIKNQKRVYDAHELFSELTEIVTRPLIHKIWLAIERFAVPKFTEGYTVNGSIAEELLKRYGVKYRVIRNLPEKIFFEKTLGTTDERFLIYQGAVNEGRCFEALIPAMKDVNTRLVICGTGNFLQKARELVRQNFLELKIEFRGNLLPEQLKQLTPQAYAGITLFESTGMNQYYSLANRFFDYMMAGIPQLCVNYPEYAAINGQFEVAYLVNNNQRATIAAALNNLLLNNVLYENLRSNCLEARQIFNWEREEQILLDFYKTL